MRIDQAVCVSAMGVVLACGVAAQMQPGERRASERPDMPPAPWAPTRTSPPMDGPNGFQANVNASGLNVVGDAGNEPSIAVDPTAPNRMVVGWRQFDSIASNFREAGVAWTNDGGRTWHSSTIENGIFRSDPVIECDTNGNFYYLSLLGADFSCQVFKSTDGGKTWPTKIPAVGGDKAWFTLDRSSTSVGKNFIYESWQTCCGPSPNAPFVRSINGTGFQSPLVISNPPPILGTLATAANGDLYISGTTANGAFGVARSTNAKNSGATPTFTLVNNINLGGTYPGIGASAPNPAGIIGQVWVDVDRSGGASNGHVYLLCTVNPNGADPADVFLARSTDGGVTWGAPVRVNNDAPGANGWQWFGTMSVAPNGRIDAIWNDTRESQNAVLSRLYHASSSNGGQTWQGNTALSAQFDSTVGWPQQNKMGDYYDMESDNVGADAIYAATFNGEQDVYYLRIGDCDCNRNGIGDAIDIANGTAKDCNANGIPDSCEIAAGAVPDVNGNGVPDECDGPVCYADCDESGALAIDDFICFQTLFAIGDPSADCDGSGVLSIDDFICFQTAFALGC